MNSTVKYKGPRHVYMTDDEVEIPMTEQSMEGQVEKMSLQTGNRVKIPDDWNDFLGIEQGDDLAILCEEDSIRIFEWSLDKLSELRDGD